MNPTQANELLASSQWIRRLALRLARDEHAADDLVQDAWRVALHSESSRSPAWLGGVVRKLALRRTRDEGARRRREERGARPGEEPPASQGLERAELQQKVLEAVLGLDEPARETVIEHHLEGRSLVAIARRQGVPSSTVRSRLAAAHERLRARLDRDFGRRHAWVALALGFREELERSAPFASASGTGPMVALGVLGFAGLLVIGGLTWRSIARGSAPDEPARADVAESAPAATELVPPLVPVEPVPDRRTAERPVEDFEPTADATADVPPVVSDVWTVEGVVRDVDGRPVPDAELIGSSGGSAKVQEVVRADRDGHYVLELASRTEAAALTGLVARHPRHRGRAFPHRFTPEELDEQHSSRDVTLGPGRGALVRVTDAGGLAIGGARVRVTDVDDGAHPLEANEWTLFDWNLLLDGHDVAFGDTGADGLCALDSLAPGTGRLIVWCPGYLSEQRTIETRGAPTIDVVLRRGGTARGEVVAPDGGALPGARVVVASAQLAITDELGRFQIGGLDASLSPVTVWVEHPDFAPLWLGESFTTDARLALDGREWRLELAEGRRVELHLVDALNGGPVPDGETLVIPVLADPFATGARLTPWVTPVTADGRLVLEHLGDHVTALALQVDGYAPTTLPLEGLTGPTTVRLQPMRSWTLVLVDARSDAPVPDGRLTLAIRKPLAQGVMDLEVPLPAPPPGSNRVPVDSRWASEGATVRWSVTAPGYRPLEGDQAFGSWPEGDVRVALEPE